MDEEKNMLVPLSQYYYPLNHSTTQIEMWHLAIGSNLYTSLLSWKEEDGHL